MLLRRSADRSEPREIEAARLESGHHPVEGFHPHQWRRGSDAIAGAWQHTMLGPVVRKCLVEQQRRLEHDTAGAGFDLDDDGREALSAGVEAEIERHDCPGYQLCIVPSVRRAIGRYAR